MRLNWEAITLHLRNPFRVSYGSSETRQAFWLRLANDEGWGEGTIPPYYQVAADDMVAYWQQMAQRQEPFPNELPEIETWVGDGPAPARCALDLALHDRIGRIHHQPLYQLLNLPAPPPMITSFTIGIDTPQEMARQAAEIAGYAVIKVKLGSPDDAAAIKAIRQARPDAQLRVDANAAYTPEEAVRLIEPLLRYDLELVEQPVAKHDIEGMGYVQARLPLPVVADESVQTLANVEQLAEAGVQGINLKLMKVGGLAPGLQILHQARGFGMKVMLGCMIETSLGVTAMAHLAGLADWVDLDAPMLISNDPFDGVRYTPQAVISLLPRPGIGVVRRQQGEMGD